MEKLIIEPAIDENNEYLKQHIEDRHGEAALAIGSKSIKGVDKEYRLDMLKTAGDAYQKIIDKLGNPGRRVFSFKTGKALGTNALYPLENIDNSAVFTTTRDYGSRFQSDIRVALVSAKDMPLTDVAHVIMGPKGEKNAGIYTMIYGDEGMPFPKQLEPDTPKEWVEFNERCKAYWDTHIFLATPEELEANIAGLKANGVNTESQEKALREFRANGEKSPILETFNAPISENAIKLEVKQHKSQNTVSQMYLKTLKNKKMR